MTTISDSVLDGEQAEDRRQAMPAGRFGTGAKLMCGGLLLAVGVWGLHSLGGPTHASVGDVLVWSALLLAELTIVGGAVKLLTDAASPAIAVIGSIVGSWQTIVKHCAAVAAIAAGAITV